MLAKGSLTTVAGSKSNKRGWGAPWQRTLAVCAKPSCSSCPSCSLSTTHASNPTPRPNSNSNRAGWMSATRGKWEGNVRGGNCSGRTARFPVGAQLRNNSGQVVYTLVPLSPSNNEQWRAIAGKVTLGLASHFSGLFTYGLTLSLPCPPDISGGGN